MEEEVEWQWRWEHGRDWEGKLNTCTNYKLITDISVTLRVIRKLKTFEASCFGHFLRFDPNAFICQEALISLLGREVFVRDRTKFERWFWVGRRLLRFSKTEFCLLTGLRFGTSTFDPDSPYLVTGEKSVYRRWYEGRSVVVEDLWSDFTRGRFSNRPKDALKIAYVLFVALYLYGGDVRASVEYWLWVLVDDKRAFQSFPWGKFAFQRLCHCLESGVHSPDTSGIVHLFGFSMALQMWAYECIPALGKHCAHRVSDDLPRGVRWRCPKRTIIDISFLPRADCFQIEPTDLEKSMPYMTDIEMDLSEGVQYVHQERLYGKAACSREQTVRCTSQVRGQSTQPRRPPTNRNLKKRKVSKSQDEEIKAAEPSIWTTDEPAPLPSTPHIEAEEAHAHACNSSSVYADDDMDACKHVGENHKDQSFGYTTPCASPISSKDRREMKLENITPIDLHLSDVSGDNDLVNINGYKVKTTTAPVLEAIFAKYGDIMAHCVCKSTSVRSSLLEVICKIVQRLQFYDVEAVLSDLEEIENEVSDLEASNIKVSWLHEHLAKLHKIAGFKEKTLQLRKTKGKSDFVSKVAAIEMERRHDELVLAQGLFEAAEKRLNVMRLVSRKIDDHLMEYESEEYFWKRRFN